MCLLPLNSVVLPMVCVSFYLLLDYILFAQSIRYSTQKFEKLGKNIKLLLLGHLSVYRFDWFFVFASLRNDISISVIRFFFYIILCHRFNDFQLDFISLSNLCNRFHSINFMVENFFFLFIKYTSIKDN